MKQFNDEDPTGTTVQKITGDELTGDKNREYNDECQNPRDQR